MISAPTLHDIYIDESSQTQNRYLVIGGLIVPNALVSQLEAAIAAARLPQLPFGEMKWAKVSSSKMSAYRRVVETVLTPNHSQLLAVEFHSLVVDTTKLKDRVYNEGSRDVGFNKEVFQLCQKFGRTNSTAIFHVYLDNRNTRSTTSELRNILNHYIMKRQPHRDWPYRRVHFRNSAACLCIQVVDILLGSIAFRLNGHYAALGASAAKQSLSDHVLTLAGVRSVLSDTRVRGRFTIWHRQLR